MVKYHVEVIIPLTGKWVISQQQTIPKYATKWVALNIKWGKYNII